MIDFKKSYIKLGEYVGANQPLELDDSVMALISAYTRVKRYPVLYRVWSYLDKDKVLEAIEESNLFRVYPANAFSKTFDAARRICREGNYESGKADIYDLTDDVEDAFLVTKHRDLVGFEPMAVLKKGLADGLAGNDVRWAKEIIDDNMYQQEIYVVKAVEEITKENLLKLLK